MTKSAPLARLRSRLRRIRITSRMQCKKGTNYTDHGLTHGMQQQPPEVSAAAGVVERGPTLDNFADSHIVARAKFACIADPIIV